MSANTQPQKSYVLRVHKGPDKGAVFKLIGRTIRIGRGPDNDVVLTDPKCSRSHAVITFSEQTIIIENLSTSSPVEIDGSKSDKSFLNPGSTISIGNTQIKFEEMNTLPVNLKLHTNVGVVAGPALRATKPQPLPQLPLQPEKSKTTFYAVLGVIILLAAWLSTTTEKEDIGIQLPTDADIDENIDNSKRRQDEIYRQQAISQKNGQQYQEANAAYLKGLRDYREGHYSRALQSFSAALAIFPNHELAQNYYNLSKKRHDELVQFTFNEAQRYMEQNKYHEAQSALQNVMILINDPNNKIYQEAREKYNEVSLIIKSSD